MKGRQDSELQQCQALLQMAKHAQVQSASELQQLSLLLQTEQATAASALQHQKDLLQHEQARCLAIQDDLDVMTQV